MTGHLDEAALWELAGAGDGAEGLPGAGHVAGCPACAARVDQMRRVRSLARAAATPPPSASARVASLQRLEAAMAREARHRVWWWERRNLLIPALGLSAAVGAGMALMVGQPSQAPLWPPAGVGAPPPSVVAAVPVVDAPVPVALNPALSGALPADTEADGPPADAPQGRTAVANRTAARPGRQQQQQPRRAEVEPAPAADPQVAPVSAPLGAPQEGPAVAAMVPAEPARAAPVVQVDVEPVVRFPRLDAARARVQAGAPLAGLDAALALLEDAPLDERAASMQLIRELAFGHPTAEVAQRLTAAARDRGEAGEALHYLACESSALGRRPADAVDTCRGFVAAYPHSAHVRHAAYVAAEFSRSRGDCAGAIEDYSKALVFTGALGSNMDDALFWRAHCRAEVGQVDASREDLQLFLARHPSRRADPNVRALQARLR